MGQLLIEDLKIKHLIKHVDDRGFLMEVLRDDDLLLAKFGQLSMSVTYPGVIKAFHYHKIQDELWFFPSGNVQTVLFDMRDNSLTKKNTNVFYMGEHNPILLYIPTGVAHGFRVLGNSSAVILTVTTKSYQADKPDIINIPFDDSEIGFDWETNFK